MLKKSIILFLIAFTILLTTSFTISKPNSSNSKNKLASKGYVWSIYIKDGFKSMLKTKGMPGFLATNKVQLSAKKIGGNSIFGKYKGTLKMECAIDKQSFLKAINSLSPELHIAELKSYINIQTIQVNFTIIPYKENTFDKANTQFKPHSSSISVAPLILSQGMAISSFITKTDLFAYMYGPEAYGGTAGQHTGQKTPFLIRIYENDSAQLYLPRMLMGYKRNYFNGKIIKAPMK